MAKFLAPVIQDNPSGWGPCAVPEKFKDMPYQPFSKGDRLGKVADWTGATYQDKRYTNKYSSQFGGGSQYAYFHEEDEASFQLVDTAKTQKTAYQRNRMRFAQRNLRRDKDRRNLTQFNMQTLPKSAKQKERDRMRLQKKFQKQFGVRQKWDQKSQLKPRDSSVEVRSDWEVKEEMDFPRLMKMRYMDVADPVDIECCGALEHYDKVFDRITTRNEKPLKSIKRIFHTVTTTDDPVIRKLAKTQGNVFATDAILATLMCCTRSVNSWDIIVQRVGNKLFFDKRDNSDFDLLTVSETANEPPQDEGNSLNSPRNLAMEATYINHNFSQQCLLTLVGSALVFGIGRAIPRSVVYKVLMAWVGVRARACRYRRWKLGEDIDLIVRCEHDGVMTGANGELSFINIKALNEWDSRHCNGVDWRQKLDSQRGAVLATELKNNSYKLARWTCCALLAGSEYLKLGYVSRYHVKDSARHVILGTQQFKPNEFASQINLSMENAWGILRCAIDICRKLDEGKYLILKDPNKQVIRIYSLPDGTFSSDEDEDEEEEDEDEDDEGKMAEVC
uniref:Eukaryotic translation initiation factor 3 subunit D n=1 Tax=Electrophorus electricus TaxID=8005 RepID=A0A4W4ED77_ELEEL